MGSFVPADYQPKLPLDRLILTDPPDEERIEMDVLFVGGGPAGLAGAIELAKLVKEDNERGGSLGAVSIGVLEKAAALGEHNLSGAVVNPRAFRELFPDLDDGDFPFASAVEKEGVFLLSEKSAKRVPTPPTMKNHGNYIASICEIVRWLGEKAEALGVDIFPGFPAEALLTEGDRVVGVRTVATGLDRDGSRLSSFMPPADITAKVTALAEGTRGLLSQAYAEWQSLAGENPQIFALGVKELWELARPLDQVIHTMGWPLPRDAFGGSFLYPLEREVGALGLVVGLDAPDASLDVHQLLQRLKTHPSFRPYFDGGELIEWGAKTIPEGGFYALSPRRSGDGVVVLGDAAGFVDVPSLKGIHYAMQSGIYAARAIFDALQAGDTSASKLAAYDRMVDASYIRSDLHRTRNVRLAYKDGFFAGSFKAGLMTMTGGRMFGKRIDMLRDADVPRTAGRQADVTPDGSLTVSKVDAVFKSANATRDNIPSHLIAAPDVPTDVAEFYAHTCPAGVYEVTADGLRINAPNCVDCKATDVVGPRWLPREGGSGPGYKRM